jgi:hypothetical protein
MSSDASRTRLRLNQVEATKSALSTCGTVGARSAHGNNYSLISRFYRMPFLTAQAPRRRFRDGVVIKA